MKGKFLVFEGIDGSGKSSQLLILHERLVREYYHNEFDILCTKEPTRSEESEGSRKLRSLLVRNDPKDGPQEFFDAFLEDRIYHVNNKLIPTLESGVHILCDRSALSTFAYQGAQGLDFDYMLKKHDGLLVPDLTILIDLSVEKASERMLYRKVIEVTEQRKFLETVRVNYLEYAKILKAQHNIVVINGDRSKEEIAEDVYQEASKVLKL